MGWIERKLEQHGVSKVVPDNDTLADAYRRMRRQALVQERIDELLTELDDGEKESLPEGLSDRVRSRLREDSALSWDAALREIV
jgi:hypothetical protein